MRKKILRVAAAQMKFRPTIEENIAVIDEMISAAAEAKCDVVLFPECALTGYNVDFSKFSLLKVEGSVQIVRALAKRRKINVILGSSTFGKKSQRFNSLVVIDRQGRETFRYHKIHLTARDATYFERGNALALFDIDGVPCTAIICHERRYPELVRLPVMMGAQIVFHANAGLDSLEISKAKRQGRDGIAIRAFENEIYYVFANSVGPQGNGLWSAGDSKIVGPDMKTLALANNRDEMLVHAEVDLERSGRKYAIEALQEPAFLRPHWKRMLAACGRHKNGAVKSIDRVAGVGN
jgi:predicted amidohydrolase